MSVDTTSGTVTVPVATVGRDRNPRLALHLAWTLVGATVALGLVTVPLLRSVAAESLGTGALTAAMLGVVLLCCPLAAGVMASARAVRNGLGGWAWAAWAVNAALVVWVVMALPATVLG